jgi:acetyl-CoA carboxylase biotin carboxyl carrier protein
MFSALLVTLARLDISPTAPMNLKELKELILFLKEEGIAEFELERGDVKVRIKRAAEPGSAPVGDTRYFAVPSAVAPTAPVGAVPVVPPTSPAPPATSVQEPEEELHMVRSPIVGTFYESPSPGSPPFVKPGDTIATGQVLCIVEAMKLMNEIESDVAGELVKRLVANGQPIEYGQELFAVRPRK